MTDKESYIERHIKAAKDYAIGAKTGSIIVNRYIKLAVERQERLAEKYYVDEDGARRFFAFSYYINLAVEGKPARFEPAPYQAWIFYNLFSYFKDEDSEYRLFKDIIIFISRKAGKTTLASILALYELLKGDRSTEAYTLSLTREQASQSLRYSKQIIKDSPALAKRVDVRLHYLQTTHNGISLFKALPAKADRLLGLSPGFLIIDEVSVFPSKEEINALTTGTLAHRNAAVVYITTASFYKHYPFYSGEYSIGKRILEGEMEYDEGFYALYELDDPKEMNNPDMWVKANPSIGVTMELVTLKALYKKAKQTVTDLMEFKVKNLNIWENGETNWIPDENYKECFIQPDIESLKGQPAYIGLDLASTRDLASLVVVIENPTTGKMEVIPEFYFPTSDNESNKIRKSGIDLTEWIEKGFIIPHESKVIDYEKILERIRYYTEIFDVQGISYDPWSSSILMSKIEAELLVDLYAAPQNTSYFSFPLKYIERLVFSKQINLSTNPVLRWNFRNIVLYVDGNNNIKVMKNKSQDSVDGAVALAMAVGLYAKLNFDTISMIMEGYSEKDVKMNKK